MPRSHTADSISVVVTLLNEQKTIDVLLDGLVQQLLPPTHVLIADGGSTDGSLELLSSWQKRPLPFTLTILQTPGNRSLGRNAAIRAATTDWIAITDAGCVPDPNWLSELCQAQQRSNSLVVAGYYYAAAPPNTLAAAMIPFALVMPDQLNHDNFLPATRSMLLHRDAWKQLNAFDESLSDNEDYAFARQLDAKKIPRSFTATALVAWQPRTQWRQVATMFFRFSRGDAAAGLVRPRVVFLFARYALLLALLSILIATKNIHTAFYLLIIGLIVYSAYSIWKHHNHVPKKAWYWLPILQLTADWWVMAGTVSGVWKRHRAS